jgi:hypothetical protein
MIKPPLPTVNEPFDGKLVLVPSKLRYQLMVYHQLLYKQVYLFVNTVKPDTAEALHLD